VKDGIATINFAPSQGDIVCYSDLVKVRVALDTGEIVGMESKGYLMNHKQRELSAPLISLEEARSHVSTQLEVTATKLALVPKDSLKEVLCYEFKGTFNGKNFLVYINADNGHEEEILMLIESEGGVLTV
ncbi:MAG: germination protein YpeB, partial [Clostridia bacterium]|nr:germination protein YpeB [Clostridia bacterium]